MSASTLARELRAAPPVEPGLPPPLRKAALLLHAMPEGDRAWLLAQLAEAERSALGALLDELRALGIPADRALLDEALRRDAVSPNDPVHSGAQRQGSARVEALRAVDVPSLAAVLEAEPPTVIARLLRISDWRWRDSLLAELPAPLRRAVRQALVEDAGATGPLLEAHLLAAVARRLADRPAQPRGRVQAFLRRIGGRKG